MRGKWGWKHIAWIVGVALGVYVIAGIVLAGHNLPQIPLASQQIDLRGGHVQGNRIQSKSWSFDYTHASLSPDGTVGAIDGVRHGIVFRKGKPYLTIAAEHISINTQTLDFTAIGKVHVERIKDPQKRSFDTDLVTWTNNAKLLHMDHPSYLHTGDQTLKLENVTVNFDTEQIHLGAMNGNAVIQK
ncbi:MAG TPA: hypothetical protein VGN11_07410 [Candidatus Baltobacteraceae bacterium]|jgi:hypothetical protein|nr:hypothetical protein [Candidatus Baltobacteraceae bacterium]